MSIPSLAPAPESAAVSVCASPDILSRILHSACNLAIWQRAPLPGIEAILVASSKEIRFLATLVELPARLDEAMDVAGFPQAAPRGEFMADVAALATRYAALCKLAQVEVRLEIVTGDACRKWHADYVTARLITTYHGRGTQWIDAADAARVKQGEEPLAIHALGAGDVGIFKGRLATDSPAIHRSPPISGSGEKRLLLVLNPPEKNGDGR